MATEFIEISEEEYQGGAGDFIEITEEEFNAPASDVGTSVEQEVSQLGAALKSGIAQPLQAMGVTAETLGMPAVGAALKGAVEQPEGYVPAAQRFMEPQAGEAQLGGFAFQYLPRAIVEQVGQLAGSVASRAAGGVIGGAAGSVVPGAGTAVGAGIGMFTGPALFEAAQIVGPVAQERAKNNGREIPNSEDLAYAWTTAGTSGALNAIGAKYLPGGEKAVGALTKRIAASLLGEGATEGAQALAQQTGETILTEKGLEIKPKAALGEALIGGVSASGATIVMSPLQKEQVDIEKEADLESRDLSIPVDDPVVRANLDKANILEQENKDSLAIINKFGVESEEGKAAQQTIVDNTDEITKLNETLPTGLSLPITTAEQQQIDLAKQIARKPAQLGAMPSPAAQTAEATYGAATGVYDVFGGITRKPVSIPKPAKLPTAPTIEEQTAERTYGGETGVFDVFAGARRKPVTPAVTPAPPVAEAPAITPAPVAETPAVTEAPAAEVAPSPIVKQSKKRKGILGEQYINKDWTSLTKDELPQLNRELYNYYDWAKTVADKLIPNANDFEKKALIMELRNEITQETAKPEFKDREQYILAQKVAGELITGKRKKILQRAKERAMGDEYAAWEMGGRFEGSPISVEAFDSNAKGRPIPKGYTKQGDLYVYQPAVSETITPAAEVAPAPVVSEEGAQVSEVTPEPTIGEEADIEAGAPPLGTDNLYFENNLAQRAWRLTAGFKYDKEKGDWFHPDYPNTPRAIAEQEITETNPPSADSVRNTLQQLKVKYGVAEPQAAAIVEPQATEAAQPEPTTFAKGDLVRIPNRVPVYKNGQLVGGRTEMVGASVVQTMPDGKVEVRLQQGGYATLAPNEIESVRKAQPTPAPVTEQAAPAEAPAPEVAPAITATPKITQLESEYNAAKAKLDALGEEPRKPSSESKFFGAGGRSKADPAVVAKYDADVKAYNSYRRKYSVAKKAEVEAANNLFYAKREAAATPTPAVSETITEPAAAPAQPAGIAVGNRIKLGKSPQTYTIEEEIPQSANDKKFGEQYYNVKNEKTGEVQTVEAKDLKPVLARVRRGEKGGVLFLTREDFIQAGQNIYEAGMEFGAWAKQMIQRFGDAVRQFLADVWEAVSGFPAKLEEMAGYLPGKGERGAVTFGRGEEPPKKPAEPAPEKPAEEKPAMERYKGKAQVAGVPGIGAEKDTPKGINKKTEEIIKDRVFDASIVNDNQTKKAWNLIQKIEEKNPESGKNAQAINELTRETMQDVEADEVVKQSIGAVKLRNELYSYAIKLAGEGDPKMLNYLLNTRLSIGSGNIVEGDAGRLLQAMASLKSWIVRATEAEQQGFFEIAAQQFFGTKTPTDEQVQQIKNIFNKVKEVKIDQEQELMDELEEVGKAAGVDLPAAVDKQLENTPGLDPMVVAITNMLKMGGTFTYRPTKNKIGEAVKNTINRGITNYRKKIVSKAANGLETGFWKTLSSTEQKPGPLGELDSAQNRALGNIVKQALVKMGLEGTPPDTKMSIYEQVASILGEQPLSQDKIKMADEKIRGGIESKRQAELENATEDQVDAINLKYDEMTIAWDDAMSRSLDMPVSDTMLRRMILNELKEADTSIQDIAKLMEEEPVIGASRQDRYVESIIEKIIGSGRYLTRINEQGKPEADYANLKTYLSDLLENMVLARQQKNKAAKDVAKTKRDASGDPEKQAQAQIDKLDKIQADPTIFGEKRIDPVRNAVRDALSLQLNIGFTPEQSAKIKANWKGAFVADPNKKGIPTSFMLELQRLGVSEAAANTLADIVWRQIEVNAMSRQMDATTKAVEAGPIGGIVQAILDTPLANQQDPEWRKNVILDYLKNAGVKPSQAENIAKLFDVSLRKRFSKAQEEAAIKAAKSIKGGLTANSRRALEKFLKAIRAQVLDPGKDVAKAFAEEMGWKGFTAEQIARLNELDAIVNDTNRTDAEIFTATEQIQKIIDKVSAPPQIKNVLSSLYVGQALLRFTTFAIQGFDPLVFTGVNTAIRSLKNVTSPTQFIQAWADYGTAISNFFRETAYSFKNDTGRSGRMIDYLENEDRKQKRLLNEAVKKFEQGNIPGAMKDAIFGYTAFTFRTLKALDDGAYSLLTSTTLPQYVEAALKNAKIPREKRKGVMRQILKARKLDIDQMVEQGIAKNDAVIYANERMQAAITKELSGLNIDAQEVINSAINDALSRIGKTRFVEDILTGKIEEIKDTGFLSSWFISFYEWAAKAANATEKESQKILYRIMFGFPLIAGRVFNAAAGYTPITLYRRFLNKDRYQLTYGTALQRRQRFIEQMAGTMVLLPLFLLRSNSLDDEEKKKRGFSIYVTGQGPSKLKDKTLHAKWNDAHKPFSMEFDFGKKGKFSIDAKSSGPFSVMIYTLGALDDWEINRKLNDLKTSKNDWREAEAKASIFSTLYEIGGYMLITTARRGPTTGLMQGLVDWRRYPDDPIAAIGAEISFSAMPAVPILGTGALKNLSDFFSQPIDNTTKEGAILANIPIVGPIAGKPALNAYSQKIGELRFSEKLKKSFGIPFTLVVRDSDEDNKLTSITLKNGKGPTPIRREDVENELKSSISDEEWYLAAKTFGDRNKKYVLENYDRYQKMSPTVFGDTISKLASESKKSAIQAVKNQREKTP